MDIESARAYRSSLVDIYKTYRDKAAFRQLLDHEQSGSEYREARKISIEQRNTASYDAVLLTERVSPEEESRLLVERLLVYRNQRELAPDEQRILKINQDFLEFFSLRAHGARDDVVHRFVRTRIGKYVHEPELLYTAAEVFKSKSIESTEEPYSIYRLALDYWKREFGVRAERLPTSVLGKLVKIRAHQEFTADFATDLLKAYFDSAQTLTTRINTLYKFASVTIDLYGDLPAFKEALLIGHFQTDVLPISSDHFVDSVAMRSVGVDDDLSLTHALIYDSVMFGLLTLTDIDNKKIQQEISREGHSDRVLDRAHYLQQAVIKKLGESKYSKKLTQLQRYYSKYAVANLYQQVNDKLWPESMVFSLKDPLRKHFHETLSDKISSGYLREAIIKQLYSGDFQQAAFESIITPGGFVLEVCFPEPHLKKSKRAILTEINKSGFDESLLIEAEKAKSVNALSLGTITFDGYTIYYFYRRASQPERVSHQIFALQSVGLPELEIPEGQSIVEATTQLAEVVRSEQRRFMNKRGVRVIFKDRPFVNLGYTSIDYYQGDNPEVIQASISVGGFTYTISLDKNFTFDLAGAQSSELTFQESLRYIMLKQLWRLLCAENLSAGGSEGVETGAKVLARMGHLRWLPEGYIYSDDAIANCYQYTRRSLITIDEERRKHNQTDRHSTYVIPVESDENVPRIEVVLSGIIPLA